MKVPLNNSYTQTNPQLTRTENNASAILKAREWIFINMMLLFFFIFGPEMETFEMNYRNTKEYYPWSTRNIHFEEQRQRPPNLTPVKKGRMLPKKKNDKWSGLDNIPSEQLKPSGEAGMHMLHTLCCQIWTTKRMAKPLENTRSLFLKEWKYKRNMNLPAWIQIWKRHTRHNFHFGKHIDYINNSNTEVSFTFIDYG